MKKIIFTVIVLATIIAASSLGAAAYSIYQKPSTTTSTATIIGYGITAALFIVQERNLSVPYALSPFDPIFPVESNYVAANVGQADFIFAAQPVSVNVTSCLVSLRKATEISTAGYNITGLYQSSGCNQPPTNMSSVALANPFEYQYVVFNVSLPNSTSPQSFTALQMNVTYALNNSPITFTYDLYHSS